MNIIHNSSQKLVPNMIFSQVKDHQHDYFHENQHESHHSTKQNISAGNKNNPRSNKSLLFQDKTNLQGPSKINGVDKPASPVVNLTTEKVNIQSTLKDESPLTNRHLPSNEVDKFKKLKPKKKVSPRKKNLKQLFDEISQKPDNDCVFLENQSESHSPKAKSSDQSFEQTPKTKKLAENKISLNQQKKLSPECQQEVDKSQQNNTLFKINKFHFLHNQLNLDSSSEQDVQEEVEETCQDIRKSSSSENDEEKIDFELPKIRNNFFIKKQDLNFDDDSDESELEQKQEPIKQIPQKEDQIKEKVQEDTNTNQEPKISSRTLTVTDFRREFVDSSEEYLKKSLPSGVSIDLLIKRDKSKKNSDSIEYQLYDSRTLRMIAVASKKSGVHEIMAKKNVEDPKAHPDVKYLTAKLQSNFLGTEFILKYVPKSNKQPGKSKSPQPQQIAETVCYQTNILGLKGPRKMSIFIPENDSVKYYGDKTLEQLHSKKCNHRIEKYVNKQAKWNNEAQSYVLNLKGKARLSSVKNFVIVKDGKEQLDDEAEKSFVIFGKISKEIFNLSVSGPFSIIQGLSLALSTFERKLICE